MVIRKFAALALAAALAVSPGVAEAGAITNTLKVVKAGAKAQNKLNVAVAKCLVRALTKKPCF